MISINYKNMPSSGKKTTKAETKTTTPTPPPPAPTSTTTKTTKATKTTTKKEVGSTTAPIVKENLPTEEVNVVVATDNTASVSANFGEFYTRFQKLFSE